MGEVNAAATNAAIEWTYEATQRLVLSKITNNKRDERKAIFSQILAGQPFAQPGERDSTLQRVASWLAFYCCDGDPEAITDLLVPSLDAMGETSPTDYISYEAAFTKVIRAQNDARDKERVKREAEANMTAAIGRMAAKGKAPAAPTPAASRSALASIFKIPDPTPEAAPVATTEDKRADSSLGSAAGIGVVPEGCALIVVPDQEAPGRATARPLPPWLVKRDA